MEVFELQVVPGGENIDKSWCVMQIGADFI